MSQYAKAVPAIVADMERQREEDQEQPEQGSVEPELVLHRYHVEGGGVVVSSVPLDEEPPPIVDANEPQTDNRPRKHKEPPFFVVVLLLFSLFLLLDSADTTLATLFTTTATVTIVPKSQTITLNTSLPLGKLLAPLTVSLSLTVPATGYKHQKATYATGTVTFSNGQQNEYTVSAGTTFTGRDGIIIITTQTAYIPAGNPSTGYGTATVTAQAVNVGSSGNIQAGDVNTTVAIAVFVRNNQFESGQDERDFQVVTQDDITNAASTLTARVTASMTAALQSQLTPGERIQPTPCSPKVTPSQNVGDEADSVTVSVSESCTAIVYNENSLQVKATQLLTSQAVKTLGVGYNRYGNLSVTIMKATTNNTTVVLTFITTGTWVYQINESSVQALVSGKPRLTALHVLTRLSGVKAVSITGIEDDQLLPTDAAHIRLFIIPPYTM